VRTEGKGRVFFSASGHDMRVWNLPAYHELVRRAILWSIGDAKAKAFSEAPRN
jgi:type 1 glutamine amidotransferase